MSACAQTTRKLLPMGGVLDAARQDRLYRFSVTRSKMMGFFHDPNVATENQTGCVTLRQLNLDGLQQKKASKPICKRSPYMFTRKMLFLAVAMSMLTSVAFAQSSGNFSYGNTGTTHCVLNNDGTGTITGGQLCDQQTGPSCTTDGDCTKYTGQLTCWNPTGGTSAGQCLNSTSGASCTSDANCTVPGQSCIFPVAGGDTGICGVVQNNVCAGALKAGIKTNSGSGNVFLVRPSAVIGLLTDASVGKNSTINIGTSSALAGVDFNVDVKSLSGQPQANVIPSFPITYASRFVQISTNLFDVLGTLCTTVSTVGGNPVGGTTTAAGCYISFNESTVSAHSFDWIVGAPAANGGGTLQSGNYGITVNWSSSLGNFGISRSLTCVGPVNLTVQQNKVFSFNTPNTF